ncbi:MAG: hypothetical protein Q8M76_13885 [Spirochaetaceae bacterium]|nr:hypothetical protein [Spirochaetaceae bacterium]
MIDVLTYEGFVHPRDALLRDADILGGDEVDDDRTRTAVSGVDAPSPGSALGVERQDEGVADRTEGAAPRRGSVT